MTLNNADSNRVNLDQILTLYRASEWNKCLDLLNTAILEQPNRPILYNLKGSIYNRVEKYHEAINFFDAAISLKTDYFEAIYNKGNALASLRKIDFAIENFHLALQHNEKFEAARIALARLLNEKGTVSEALNEYYKVLDFSPNSFIAYNDLGGIYRTMGNIKEAIVCFKKALGINNEFSEAYCNLGAAHQDAREFDNAISNYKDALRISPGLIKAQYNLGTLYYDQGKYALAKERFDKCGRNDVTQGLSLECLYLMSKYEEFTASLVEYVKVNQTNRRVAALSAYAANQLLQEDIYPFCASPLDYVYKGQLAHSSLENSRFVRAFEGEMTDIQTIWEPASNTTKKGYRTIGNLFELPSENIQKMELYIRNHVETYFNKYTDSQNLFIKEWPKAFSLQGWFNRLVKGGNHISHIHPAGWLSGVVYLNMVDDPQKDEGAIKFSLHGYNYPILRDEIPANTVQPQSGEIVLFPSSLFHETIPLIQDSVRCAVAFDIIPIMDN